MENMRFNLNFTLIVLENNSVLFLQTFYKFFWLKKNTCFLAFFEAKTPVFNSSVFARHSAVLHLFSSQPIWAETWSSAAAASLGPAARSTRARSCPRTRWCSAPAASGAYRTRGPRWRTLWHSWEALKCGGNLERLNRFLSFSLKRCSLTSWWRSCPTTITWRRRGKDVAPLWGTEDTGTGSLQV